MLVREARKVDVEQIANLEQQIFSDAWSAKSVADSLEQGHCHIWVVIEEADIIEGYMVFYTAGGDGDLARIAVVPEFRRRGVARLLMEQMWNYCKEFGYNRVLLEVRESNVGAVSLYCQQGFRKLGIRKNYYNNPVEDAVIMEKELDISSGI